MAGAAPFGFRIELLNDRHIRTGFSSGVDALDIYFRTQASQDARRRVTACFVLVADDESVAGYYTLSAASITLTDLPAALSKKLPRYPAVPATLMGRLAIDSRHRRKGFGELLLLDAFSRTLRSEIASYAFVVDAKNDAAQAFYERYGFRQLSNSGRRLFLTLAEISALFA